MTPLAPADLPRPPARRVRAGSATCSPPATPPPRVPGVPRLGRRRPAVAPRRGPVVLGARSSAPARPARRGGRRRRDRPDAYAELLAAFDDALGGAGRRSSRAPTRPSRPGLVAEQTVGLHLPAPGPRGADPPPRRRADRRRRSPRSTRRWPPTACRGARRDVRRRARRLGRVRRPRPTTSGVDCTDTGDRSVGAARRASSAPTPTTAELRRRRHRCGRRPRRRAGRRPSTGPRRRRSTRGCGSRGDETRRDRGRTATAPRCDGLRRGDRGPAAGLTSTGELSRWTAPQRSAARGHGGVAGRAGLLLGQGAVGGPEAQGEGQRLACPRPPGRRCRRRRAARLRAARPRPRAAPPRRRPRRRRRRRPRARRPPWPAGTSRTSGPGRRSDGAAHQRVEVDLGGRAARRQPERGADPRVQLAGVPELDVVAHAARSAQRPGCQGARLGGARLEPTPRASASRRTASTASDQPAAAARAPPARRARARPASDQREVQRLARAGRRAARRARRRSGRRSTR